MTRPHDSAIDSPHTTGPTPVTAQRIWVWVLLAIVVLRAVLAIVLWEHAGGYFWLTGDDAARTQLAYAWSRAPFFNLPGNVWPPLGIWLHGLVLKVVEDPLAVSSAVNSVFSIGTVVVIYRLTAVLFPERPPAAALAAAMAGFCPLVVWLGLSGLSEAIFHFFLLAAVYAWALAYRDDRPWLHLAAALGLLGASMVRLEAWLLIGVFGVYCVVRSARKAHAVALLSSALLASLFAPAWLWWHWRTFGDPVAFLQVPQANNAGGLAAADFTRFISLLWDNSPMALILASFGIVAARKAAGGAPDRTRRAYLIFVVGFFLCFALATRGRLASNMPVRNLTAFYLLVVPFSAYALAFLAALSSRATVVAAVAVAALVAGGAAQSFGYSFQAGDSVVRIATWSRRVIRSGAVASPPDKILIEARRGGAAERLVVWDSLFLHAVHPRYTIYDRRPRLTATADTWVIAEANNPSLLEGTASEVRERLRSRQVRFVIAYSAPAREVLDSFMTPVSASGPAEDGRGPGDAAHPQDLDYFVYEWPADGQTTREWGRS